jgi:hypothetical protein
MMHGQYPMPCGAYASAYFVRTNGFSMGRQELAHRGTVSAEFRPGSARF